MSELVCPVPTIVDNAPFTPDEFRCEFPCFADDTVFTESEVVTQINLASEFLPRERWKDLWVRGCKLLVAHNIALVHQMTGPGGYGYGGGGFQTGGSKTVGRVSKSTSYSPGIYANAGTYGETVWGRMLWQLIRMVGAGGTYAWNKMQTRGVSPWSLLNRRFRV